jgi:hypothetical protein
MFKSFQAFLFAFFLYHITIVKTKLKTATRAHTSYTRSASCFLKALCLYVKLYIGKHTWEKKLDWRIYVQIEIFHWGKNYF